MAAVDEHDDPIDGKPRAVFLLGRSDGARRIAEERSRQIGGEGWTPEHDDEHDDNSLVWAALCYAAAPERIYRRRDDHRGGASFEEAWPHSWSEQWDKRPRKYDNDGDETEDLATPTREERIRLLEKAGALIAAEIDREIRAMHTCAECGRQSETVAIPWVIRQRGTALYWTGPGDSDFGPADLARLFSTKPEAELVIDSLPEGLDLEPTRAPENLP